MTHNNEHGRVKLNTNVCGARRLVMIFDIYEVSDIITNIEKSVIWACITSILIQIVAECYDLDPLVII